MRTELLHKCLLVLTAIAIIGMSAMVVTYDGLQAILHDGELRYAMRNDWRYGAIVQVEAASPYIHVLQIDEDVCSCGLRNLSYWVALDQEMFSGVIPEDDLPAYIGNINRAIIDSIEGEYVKVAIYYCKLSVLEAINTPAMQATLVYGMSVTSEAAVEWDGTMEQAGENEGNGFVIIPTFLLQWMPIHLSEAMPRLSTDEVPWGQ